jgi:fructoselysine-6-P-deglycase FrlB-like protein
MAGSTAMQAFSHRPQPVHTVPSTVGVKRPPPRVRPCSIVIALSRSGQARQQLSQRAAPMKL